MKPIKFDLPLNGKPNINETSIEQFVINNDGLAFDTATGLTWLRFAYGQTWHDGKVVGEAEKVFFEKARVVAAHFNEQGGYVGYTDWRLPTLEQLRTLREYKGSDSINTDVFPTSDRCFWSYLPNINKIYSCSDFVTFNYDNGKIEHEFNACAVRLVRSDL